MIHLIGIDCAAPDAKCGRALGTLTENRVTVLDVVTEEESVLSTLLRLTDRAELTAHPKQFLGASDAKGPDPSPCRSNRRLYPVAKRSSWRNAISRASVASATP
jgi:hypothetical protein